MEVDKETIENMTHMTGLSYKRIPYRNYYNSGRSKKDNLDNLVNKGMAVVFDRGIAFGNYYYHLTEKGFQYILDNRDLFNLDKRIKNLKTLISKAED